MPENKISILSTRPLNEASIQQAKSNNVFIDVVSFIQINFIQSEELMQQIQSLANENITAVFTSVNAVDAVTAIVSPTTAWKIYCMGNTTKKAIKEYFGYGRIAATASNANELAQKIIDAKQKHVVFFCGTKRLDLLPEKLLQHEIDVTEIAVYETIETPQIIEQQYDGILFFSPSGVESFFSNNIISKKTILFAIGNTTAEAIKKYSQNKIIISDKPGKEMLIAKTAAYFQTNQIHP